MTDLIQQLALRFQTALRAAFGDEYSDADPLIARANNPKFGDYQANVAMPLAKQLKQKPRDVAQAIVDALEVDDLCDKIEIAGPGFINLYVKNDVIAEQLAMLADDPTPAPNGQTVVVDYGGPNVAKEMHVGHLRSTIIGDAIVRVLQHLGCTVIRQNHVGDWGTQFGMLIQYLRELRNIDEYREAGVHQFRVGSHQPEYDGSLDHVGIRDLNTFYQAAKKKFDDDEEFRTRARERVVLLQQGDERTLHIWRLLVDESRKHFDHVYERLGVLLDKGDIRGESFYNDRLPAVVADLDATGLLTESQGAKVVFPEGFKDKEGDPLAMIVQKGDGGYLYATTDLAAARYRIEQLGASRVVYVADSRQTQHFAMVFQTLRESGFAPPEVRLDHVPFGTVLGKDRKPFKTRSGEVLKLVDLLDEADERAMKVLEDKGSGLDAAERARVAQVVGIGALKYADLSTDRIKDYVFDWDRMLAMDGNTAPYLVNAYVRIRSIFRKAPPEVAPGSLRVVEPAERTLALQLLQLPAVVASVGETLEPHRLCGYLYDLASAFHQFYEHCPVLGADDEATRGSRLALCALTADVLRRGLDLLGIGTVEQM